MFILGHFDTIRELLMPQQNSETSCNKNRSIFVQFMTMREQQILARPTGIQKENWG